MAKKVEKTAKIVILKEGINAYDFASSESKGKEYLDAVSFLQTEQEPPEDAVLYTNEAAFYTCNMSEEEAKNLEKSSEVVAVEEDSLQYALTDEGDFIDDFAPEPDPESEAELEEELENLDFTEEDFDQNLFNNLTQNEPAGIEENFLAEMQLIEGAAEGAAEQLSQSSIPKPKLLKIIKCVIKCVLKEAGGAANVDFAAIEKALQAQGVGGDEATIMADVLLWNIRLIYANYAWRFSTGAGVRMAIVDTGIRPRHPDIRVYGGVSYVPGVRSWADDNGHGTHCAGIAAARRNGRGMVGVAPNARLYAVKVLNRRGSGRLSWILNGLVWCGRRRMHVVNLSLGSRPNPDNHSWRNYSVAYERVGRWLRRNYGTLLVAAAGNRGGRPVSNPARCPSYMAVGAIDRRRRLASFSSIGPQVEIVAPGVNIISTYPARTYRSLSGTSMAAPHVAGVGALIKSRFPSIHGDRMRIKMWRTAIDLGRAGRDPYFGYGQVNAYRAVL